jgi:hypothetical protein
MKRKKVPKNMKMTGINKITLKIQEKPGIKMDYDSCPLFTILIVYRHCKMHFPLALYSKFVRKRKINTTQNLNGSKLLGDQPKHEI